MSLPEPSPLWQWHFDPEENWLCLSLDELGALKTGVSRKNMRDSNFQFEAFSVSDTEYYMELLENLENTPLITNPRFAFITCINSLASSQFHKEVSAKNWFFLESSKIPLVGNHQLAAIQTPQGKSDVIVMETKEEFCSCLLLQSLQLNADKSLAAFSTVKLSINRLFSFTGQSLDTFNE